jgi:hypothetical protein
LLVQFPRSCGPLSCSFEHSDATLPVVGDDTLRLPPLRLKTLCSLPVSMVCDGSTVGSASSLGAPNKGSWMGPVVKATVATSVGWGALPSFLVFYSMVRLCDAALAHRVLSGWRGVALGKSASFPQGQLIKQKACTFPSSCSARLRLPCFSPKVRVRVRTCNSECNFALPSSLPRRQVAPGVFYTSTLPLSLSFCETALPVACNSQAAYVSAPSPFPHPFSAAVRGLVARCWAIWTSSTRRPVSHARPWTCVPIPSTLSPAPAQHPPL